MGRYCWMCGHTRPNEQFSGRGHARGLCKRCARQPRAERERIRALIDLGNYLDQKNISAGNIARLRHLCDFKDDEVRSLASLILEIALVHPRKKKRLGFLRHRRPELYDQLVERGYCMPWIEDPEPYFEETGWVEDAPFDPPFWKVAVIDPEGDLALEDRDIPF